MEEILSPAAEERAIEVVVMVEMVLVWYGLQKCQPQCSSPPRRALCDLLPLSHPSLATTSDGGGDDDRTPPDGTRSPPCRRGISTVRLCRSPSTTTLASDPETSCYFSSCHSQTQHHRSDPDIHIASLKSSVSLSPAARIQLLDRRRRRRRCSRHRRG